MHAQILNAIVGKTIVAQHQRRHNKARVPSLEMFTNVFNEFFGNDNSTTCTTQCISQKCYKYLAIDLAQISLDGTPCNAATALL